MTKIPPDDILEVLYKLRIRESEKLKTVLELYDLETHQKKLGPDYHRLDIRNKNFGARNGNFEKNAVVKNQGTNSVYIEFLETVGNGKPTGSVWKETIAVSATTSISVEKSHHHIRLRILSCSRWAKIIENPKSQSPSGRMCRSPCKDYLKGSCNNSFCEKWHPPECLIYKTKSGCRFGEKCSYAHRQVDEQPTKRSKKNDDKSAVAMLKKDDWHERRLVTDQGHDRSGQLDKKSDKKLGRRSSQHRSSDARQLGCVFQDITPPKFILRKSTDMRKPIQRVRFTKATARHTKIRDQNWSLGYICPGEPHERSPNATTFEDRSQEETEWQEQGAHEAAWKLAKSVLKLKEHERATFFSTFKPEEREFVVDSGASMHMISKKDLSDAEIAYFDEIMQSYDSHHRQWRSAKAWKGNCVNESPREHASSIVARKALRWKRVFLRMGQWSETTSHQKRDSDTLQYGKLRSYCCSRRVSKFVFKIWFVNFKVTFKTGESLLNIFFKLVFITWEDRVESDISPVQVSTSVDDGSGQPDETTIERGNPLESEIPEWLQEFREILVDEEIPVHGGFHASSSHEASLEPTFMRREDLGKHSVNTHFPKDRNCEICKRTKITRAPCRRRNGEAVPRAANFGDLTTADHKVLSDNCESRNNHRHAVVVQDSATWWIQAYPCKNKNFTRNPEKLAKVPGTRWETKSHLHWQFLGILQSVWRFLLESLHVDTTQIRNKWDCWKSSAQSTRKHLCCIVAIWSKWKLVGRFHRMLHISAKLSRSIVWWEDSIRKAFWRTSQRTNHPFESLVENHPTTAKDQSSINLEKESYLDCSSDTHCTREGIWKGDVLIPDFEELETMDASEICSKRLTAKEGTFPKEKGEFVFPIADGRIKPLGGDQNWHLPIRGESHLDFLGKTEGCLVQPQDSLPDAGEAINDFWSMSGNFIYRHHVEPRVKLHSPREESFPVPRKYIDVSRTTHTNLDVMQESRIDDHWNIVGSIDLSDSWTRFTQFTLLDEKRPDGHMWSRGRLTRKQLTSRPDHVWPELWKSMGKHAKLKEKQKWSNENLHLENARKLRGICFIDPEDKEFKETIKNARKKLETPIALAMPWKIMKKNCGNGASNKNQKPNLRVFWKLKNICETAYGQFSTELSRRPYCRKRRKFITALQFGSQICSCASSRENSCSKGSSGQGMGKIGEIFGVEPDETETKKKWSMKQRWRAQKFILHR